MEEPMRGRLKEDVEVLLAAGIDVLTTMNIQHLESLNDQVLQISGIRVRETIRIGRCSRPMKW